MNIASGAALGTIEEWFERSGYTDIKSKSNPLRGLSSGDLTDVNRYYAEGRRVVLRINADLLNAKTQSDWSLKGDHIVVLTSPINLAAPKGGVQFTVFTWGQGTFEIPQGAPLSEKDLLSHLYGYIEPPLNEWTPVVGSLSPEVSNGTSTSVIYRRVQAAGC